MTALKYIKLKSLEDLTLVAISLQTPLIHYINFRSKHVYFIPFIMTGDSGILYFYESGRPIKSKYILYNKFDGSISLSERLIGDTRLTFIPIVEVTEQNIIPSKIFEGKGGKKKEGKGK